jgi:hypothetical protein
MASTNGGAPVGNKNATKNKVWSDALRKAIIQGKSLDKIAKKVIAMAEDGDMVAIREIGDRLEGKPITPIEARVDASLTVISKDYRDA